MIDPVLPGALAGAAADAAHAIQSGDIPSLRPYIHVFLAYGAAWLLILVWIWRISSSLRALARSRTPTSDAPPPPA